MKLEATVRDGASRLVKDEEVTFQKRYESGAWTTIETKKTNALGVASINTTETEAGKWEYRARVGSTTLGAVNAQIREVSWAGTRATKIDGSVAESLAVDEQVTITFNVTDAFENGVNGQAVKFVVDSRPTGASSKTETLVPGPVTNSDWKNGEVKFSYTPNRIGQYTVKATVLDGAAGTAETGLTKTMTFNAVEGGTRRDGSFVLTFDKDDFYA